MSDGYLGLTCLFEPMRKKSMKNHVLILVAATVFGFHVVLVSGCGDPEEDDPDDPDDEVETEVVDDEPAIGLGSGENVCGGTDELTIGGEPASPGSPCGPCEDGMIVCDGGDDLRCEQASEPTNECGGCEPLHADVGDPCGPCDEGSWECDGDDGLECVGQRETNACGGCVELEGTPGELCGDDGEGILACSGPEETHCITHAEENACGGTGSLDATPGTPCGACDQGVVACFSETTTTCVDEERGLNDCGGCEPLTGTEGDVCGACDGELVCDGDDDLRCEGGEINACGGCEELEAFPGQQCRDGLGWVCDGPDDVRCPETFRNPCGGHTSLDAAPGMSCGPCDEGRYVCSAPESLTCSNANTVNACGGCLELEAEPMTECGPCNDGTWICGSTEGLTCVDDAANACGGCGELTETPGTPCSPYGRWQCADEEGVECVGWEVVFDAEVGLGSTVWYDIWASAPDDIWAVGSSGTQAANVLAHDDGGGWEFVDLEGVVATPDELVLRGIWGAQGGQRWAVGHYYEDDPGVIEDDPDDDLEDFDYETDRSVVLRCDTDCADGENWYDLGDGATEPDDFLEDGAFDPQRYWSAVDGSSPFDVWVVGYGLSPEDTATQQDAGFRYLGGDDWRLVDYPLRLDGDSQTQQGWVDVWAGGGGEAWAVGITPGIIYSDGDDWEWVYSREEDEGDRWPDTVEVKGEKPDLFHPQAIWGSGADDVWVVGSSGTVVRYNGEAWEEIETPFTSRLNSVTGTGPDDVWVGGLENIIAHYDGTQWTVTDATVDDPFPIWAMTGTEDGELWAVSRHAILHLKR